MIDKMLKTTIICREDDREETLLNLRSLGVLHVEQIKKPDHQSLTTLEQGMDKLSNIINILSEYTNAEAEPYSKKSPRSLSKMALDQYDRLSDANKNIISLNRERILLEPWGDFSFELIDKLKEKGLYVNLCVANKRTIKEFRKFGVIETVNTVKDKIYFALISEQEIPKTDLPAVNLPTSRISINEIDDMIRKNRYIVKESTSELQSIALSINEIKLFQKEIQQQYDFLYNKHGMGESTELAYILGYIPEKKKKRISNAAIRCGWAITFVTPSAEDRVPTSLKIPKIFSLISPIFDFIGISPGYNEWDVSICFLFFFTIFFGMIVGDAGYGLIFVGVGIALKIIYKKNRQARLPLNLFLLLSIATIVWGMLTCTYFGLPQKIFPGPMHGLKALTDPAIKNNNIMFVCFTLGAIHLSFARVWKAFIYKNRLIALGQIGWGMFLWGNYFTALKLIVYPDMTYPVFAFYLYVIGLILILLFYVQWKDAGSIFNTPFDFIGSFVDLLSYIRLFAVGLATFYIASSFNDMSRMVFNISPWLLILALIVIALGHLLNIALAFMGVLVHGIRLNTLEFSNHMELEWTGFFYKPFKRLVRDKGKIDTIEKLEQK
jgi:V/A-type H+/Na+-transporting ATPase subunit I